MVDFFVGQKVVKIKVGEGYPTGGPMRDIGDLVVDGQVYEVRWVGVTDFWECKGEPSIRLVGHNRVIQHKERPGEVGIDYPYGAMNFRPVQETAIKQTVSKAIELFRRLAVDATTKKKITVPAE